MILNPYAHSFRASSLNASSSYSKVVGPHVVLFSKTTISCIFYELCAAWYCKMLSVSRREAALFSKAMRPNPFITLIPQKWRELTILSFINTRFRYRVIQCTQYHVCLLFLVKTISEPTGHFSLRLQGAGEGRGCNPQPRSSPPPLRPLTDHVQHLTDQYYC